MTVFSYSGVVISMGMVASFIAEALQYFPALNNAPAVVKQGMVVVLCVILDVVGMYVSHQPITVSIIAPIILSYASASTTYLHLFKTPNTPAVPVTPVA